MFTKRFSFLLVFLSVLILASSVWGAVILDQPVSTENTFAYYNQEYVPGEPAENDVYIADDFVLDKAWGISTIFVPGDFRYAKLGGYSTLLHAATLNWEIYEDVNGKPAGDPRDLVNVSVWRLSLPPNDPRVVLSLGTKGYPTNVTLNLGSPIYLNPGTYWLIFYPELDWEMYGGYGRQPADTDNNKAAQAVKPIDTYTYFPTTWTSVSVIPWNMFGCPELSHKDFAFRLEGGLVQDIGVEPTTLSFGSVQVGQTKDLEVTISSKGTGNLTLSGIEISGTSDRFSVDVTGGANPCNSSNVILAAGNSCTVVVTFSPTNLVSQTGSLDITSNDPDTTTTQVPLSGTGVSIPAPDIAVAPVTKNFGQVLAGQAASQIFTISNNGSTNLTITDMSISGNSAGMFSVEPAGTNSCVSLTPTITPTSSCTVAVIYAPTIFGAHSAFLDIDSNDPDFATFQVNLSGTGVYEVAQSTYEGTIGTEITFSDSPSGFGTAKGKVLIQNASTKMTAKIAKGGWTNDRVTCTVRKALPAGVYDVVIVLKSGQTYNLPGAFTFKKPEILNLNRYSGTPSTQVAIGGNFFGSKKPKVYLEYDAGKKKNCAVKAYQMDTKTGDSAIGFLVPKGLPVGTYQLRVETKKVGISVEDVKFTITPSDF